jgi:hypothetical protein
MAGEWEETTVGELVKRGVLERPLDGNHGSIHPKGADFVPSGVPFIMASDLVGGGIDTVSCSFITREQATSLRSDVSMLAPSFDHGAALARNEPETKRERRLHGPDLKYNIENFAKKASSSLYGDENASRPLDTLEAFRHFSAACPASAQAWLRRLSSLTRDEIESIVDCIPASRMSTLAREFTIKLLMVNQGRLLAV